jgi:hypothetical protein
MITKAGEFFGYFHYLIGYNGNLTHLGFHSVLFCTLQV